MIRCKWQREREDTDKVDMCCMGKVSGTLHHNTSNKTLIIVKGVITVQ